MPVGDSSQNSLRGFLDKRRGSLGNGFQRSSALGGVFSGSSSSLSKIDSAEFRSQRRGLQEVAYAIRNRVTNAGQQQSGSSSGSTSVDSGPAYPLLKNSVPLAGQVNAVQKTLQSLLAGEEVKYNSNLSELETKETKLEKFDEGALGISDEQYQELLAFAETLEKYDNKSQSHLPVAARNAARKPQYNGIKEFLVTNKKNLFAADLQQYENFKENLETLSSNVSALNENDIYDRKGDNDFLYINEESVKVKDLEKQNKELLVSVNGIIAGYSPLKIGDLQDQIDDLSNSNLDSETNYKILDESASDFDELIKGLNDGSIKLEDDSLRSEMSLLMTDYAEAFKNFSTTMGNSESSIRDKALAQDELSRLNSDLNHLMTQLVYNDGQRWSIY